VLFRSAPASEQILCEIKRGGLDDGHLTSVVSIPWRSLSILVLSVPALLLLIRYTVLSPKLLVVLWIAGPILLPLIELAAQRHYLTPTSLVRRYGIAGCKRRSFALTDIEQVEVVHPTGLNTGTLVIRGSSRSISITEVLDAEAVAQAILVAKSRVPLSSSQAASSHSHTVAGA
jgi:hypothetical protein